MSPRLADRISRIAGRSWSSSAWPWWPAWATYPSPPAWTAESFVSFILDRPADGLRRPAAGALLLRHPDAPRVARPLVFGTLLFAAVPFLRLAGPSLEGFFDRPDAAEAELEWFVPSSILYGYFHSLLGLFGVLYVALGLSQARHWAYRAERPRRRFRRAGGRARRRARDHLLVHAGRSERRRHDAATVGVPHRLDRAERRSRSSTWSYLAMSLVRCALSGEEPGLGVVDRARSGRR